MRTIVSINAKGGCGKSTIAMNLAAALALRGHRTLLVDMDPQAQVTQWLRAGDGIGVAGTLTAVFAGRETFADVIQATDLSNLWFVAASEPLEHLGREMTDVEGYHTAFATMLTSVAGRFDFAVIDSPNQISPVMENTIWPADLFVVPFESTKAVRSYANFYQLVLKLRPAEDVAILHVLSNLSRQAGLRRRVIATMAEHGIRPAATEVRTCGWLAQVDEHGGSIFAWRPHSLGAADMMALAIEVEGAFGDAAPMPNDGASLPAATVVDSVPMAQPLADLSAALVPHIDEPSDAAAGLGTFKLRDGELIPHSSVPSSPPLPPPSEEEDLINHFTI